MKLKEFNSQNCITSGRQGPPRISIGKDGRFVISHTATALLELKSGDKVSLFQDEEDLDNWYLLNNGQEGPGFTVKLLKQVDKSMGFSNSILRDKICDGFEAKYFTKKGTLKFLIAGQPTELNNKNYWGLLVCPT